jgi:hypothetical protein
MDLPQMPGTDQGGYAGYRSGEQLLPRDLRHCGGNQSDQCGPDGRTDGGVWWRRGVWTLRVLPTQSVGDGGSDRGLGGFRADGSCGASSD